MKKNSCYFTFMGLLIFLFKGRCCWRNVIKWFRCGNNKKITGSSANDLLSDATFKSMVVKSFTLKVLSLLPSLLTILFLLNARTNKSQRNILVKEQLPHQENQFIP
jgi:hypothetical protein